MLGIGFFGFVLLLVVAWYFKQALSAGRNSINNVASAGEDASKAFLIESKLKTTKVLNKQIKEYEEMEKPSMSFEDLLEKLDK